MMKYLMLSCREATRLTEKKLTVGKLSFWGNLQLAMHIRMCDRCQRYAGQSAVIEKALHRQFEAKDETTQNLDEPKIELSEFFREQLLQRLDNGEEHKSG